MKAVRSFNDGRNSGVRVNGGMSEYFDLIVEARQECIMSSRLLSPFEDGALYENLRWDDCGEPRWDGGSGSYLSCSTRVTPVH